MLQVSSLTAELESAADSSQGLERQLQSAEQSQRELERQVEAGERSREEMQGAAQQAKAADVQVKALQARLTQATEATADIGKELAEARTQVVYHISSSCWCLHTQPLSQHCQQADSLVYRSSAL